MKLVQGRVVSLLQQQWQTRPMLIIVLVFGIVTMVWGSSFLVIQQALVETTPLLFMTLRFGIALPFLTLLFHKQLTEFTTWEIKGGLVNGLMLFTAVALITIGLEDTLSSKAAFITSLYVVFVPLISIPLLRRLPRPVTVLSVVIALVGLGLLSLDGSTSFSLTRGELLILGGAFAAGVHIIALSHFSPKSNVLRLTLLQVVVTLVLSVIALLLSGEAIVIPPPKALSGALYIGTVVTAIPFVGMTWAQQHVSSTRAALFYALEPVWAVFFGYMAGERLGASAVVGCLLILTAIIIGDLKLPKRKKRLPSEPKSAPAK